MNHIQTALEASFLVLIAENIKQGMTPKEAKKQAMKDIREMADVILLSAKETNKR